MQKLAIIEKAVQIVVWLFGATLVLLTYLQARRTILQPISTEVFKLQLPAMSEVLKLFVGKDELALRKEFTFDTLIFINAITMYHEYARTFFDRTFEPEEQHTVSVTAQK